MGLVRRHLEPRNGQRIVLTKGLEQGLQEPVEPEDAVQESRGIYIPVDLSRRLPVLEVDGTQSR